jgi:uncharacterized membrane protein (UPF0127 family)
MTVLRVIAILGCSLLLSGQSAEDGDLDSAFRKDTLIVSADKYACWLFDIYIASSNAQRSRGLMHVRDLPEFTGMIFIYGQARILSMWMKNTYIPLDMLFIRGDGTVASIATHTTPLSLESVTSGEPVNMVLELNAGLTEKLGIGTESRIVFSNQE